MAFEPFLFLRTVFVRESERVWVRMRKCTDEIMCVLLLAYLVIIVPQPMLLQPWKKVYTYMRAKLTCAHVLMLLPARHIILCGVLK